VKKSLFWLLTLASFVFCSGPLAREAGAGPSSPQDARTVVDMAGRAVSLPQEIKRIGTIGSVGVLNAFVELMGEGSKIYNQMPAQFTKNDQWAMQYEFAPQIANGPLFESGSQELLIENIIASEIDVCFVMNKGTAQILEDKGITCVYLEWKKQDDIYKAVTLMGEALKKQETAEKYIRYFDDKLAQAKQLTAGLPENEKVKVLYGNPITFFQPHIIAEWWLTMAGGLSVTNDGRKEETLTYTMEDLLAWNPEVMILQSASLIKEIENNPIYGGISAVEKKAFYVIPTVAHVWGNRTVEQPLTILWTINKLYPKLIPYDKLKDEIKFFYKTFYLYDLSDEQIDRRIEGKK
jgi:iron complex transport system substrate-binding protein